MAFNFKYLYKAKPVPALQYVPTLEAEVYGTAYQGVTKTNLYRNETHKTSTDTYLTSEELLCLASIHISTVPSEQKKHI